MMLELREGYSDRDTVRELFLEYTEYLISQDAKFGHYLELQNYDGELEHPEVKYGRPNGRLYVAYLDGAPAGCIALLPSEEGDAELKRLYVRPAFRGRGVALALVERLLDDAREIGYKSVRLDTLPFLGEAIALYRKFGFCEIPPYNDNPMGTSIYMKLDL